MLEKLFSIHQETVKHVPLSFRRYLHKQIHWKEGPLCLVGPRGVGKTTLLLQHYHDAYADVGKCLYISADHVDVTATGLFNAADEYFKMGGEALIIDEIHKYPNWTVELKNIIDVYKAKKIMVSGSSSLKLKQGKGDLSRRLVYYDLAALSFREYLELKEKRMLLVLSLTEVLKNHLTHAQRISKDGSILKSFKNYLRYGVYPFFVEGEGTYFQKVNNVIEKILYEEVATMGRIKPGNMAVLKKILWVIATASPFVINIEKLSRDLKISKQYVYAYLELLEHAGLIAGLKHEARGLKLARKPVKLFLENTSLLQAIAVDLRSEAELGTMRETFFFNQMKVGHRVAEGETGDFVVDGRYEFEIGGKNKEASSGYVAADGIEIGVKNKIPLYLFGFLY